jgi:hypothetical protein
MSCVYRGRLSVLFSLFVAALCVSCLLPHVFWLTSTPVNTDVVKVVSRQSLWITCNTTTLYSTTGPDLVTTDCSKATPVSIFNISNYKDERSAEQKGTIAGLVLGGLLALIALFTALCEAKGATIGLLFFSFVFVGASVGAYTRYKVHFLDDTVGFYLGFYLCATTVAMVLLSCFGACAMNKNRVAYHEFA